MKEGHLHNELFKNVTLDEMFRIGKEDGWSDEYIHIIWNMKTECLDLETQGWCEQCFREQFGKVWPIFNMNRQRFGLQ